MKIVEDYEKTLSPTSSRKRSAGQEILIAFAIFAVVTLIGAALLIPNVIQRTGQAKVEKTKADLSMLREAIDQFHMDCKRYPTTQEGFGALLKAPKGLKLWKGPYMRVPMFADPWGNAYVYQTPGPPNGHDGYLIESYGADGAPGGEGDNADIMDGSG